MIEKPNLPDDQILTCLQDAFGIHPARIEFLPIGNDARSWVYRVHMADNTGYFLKVKHDAIYEPSLIVPRLLNDYGIKQVVAPIGTAQGHLKQEIEGYDLILYPFIEGRTGMGIGMTDDQWRAFGRVLKQIHQTQLPQEISELVQDESFIPNWSPVVRILQRVVPKGEYKTSPEVELAAFWKQKCAEIQAIMERTEALGRMLRENPGEYVLCHTDIHTANILIDEKGDLHIVDWDYPFFAPKERDLMFVLGKGGSDRTLFGREQHMFFEGYGRTDINPLMVAYYRYEWVVQEIGDYGQRVFLTPEVGEETKKAAVAGFQQLFRAGDVVEQAYRADRHYQYSAPKNTPQGRP